MKINDIIDLIIGVSVEWFVARDICIWNTAGPKKGQAVALRVSSDRAVFYRCHIDAYQDTLYAHKYQQFYIECQITGKVDFICGDATAVFQNFQIEAHRPLVGQSNVITAQSLNDTSEVTGFSFQRCNITASPDFTPVKATVKTFVGRITVCNFLSKFLAILQITNEVNANM